MLRRSLFAAAAAPAILSRPAGATDGPVVVELFTSQSCSSCPPADALLGDLAARQPGVLALSFHVTYWDRLGWRDRFSLPEATERQQRYARSLGHGQLYTPQIVVQGRRDAVGSDRSAVLGGIAAAAPAPVAIGLAITDQGLRIDLPEGAGGGTVWLIGYDARHVTRIGGGENGGRTLSYTNVVRSIAPVGAWQGRPSRLTAPRPGGEHIAVLLQGADGAILGAARS
ncbi:DUF1223 domain-containing protein [Roseomonas sp. HJA6]|uniref:DUF1223 domain-containing protein n=1 Tax=Roseomonas alba TaxID=2846776 RepID=A0ABS7ABZ9_9PROT|nr:DUF1223 domain-containing protein [Neoroseomonas alba]MBW6398704.1 DUF1223 domain-containing protein [Neoroseomonas alba]